MREFVFVVVTVLTVTISSVHAVNTLINPFSRPYEKLMMCRDGYAHDQLFPDEFTYTCKPGPGVRVKCTYIYSSLDRIMQCPGFSYISGWHVRGNQVDVKCCYEKGLSYLPWDCVQHYNNEVANGRVYRVFPGKVITGFRTMDDGISYANAECKYIYTREKAIKAY